MANQITDNRTIVTNADAVAAFDDLSGNAAGTLDTEIFIQGTGSIGEYLSNSLAGLLFDAGSAQDWSSNVFYIWVNCGLVGLLDTKANGGFRIRFCGATVTNWFEVYVAGSDEWPPSVSGGWTQFVVDIEEARATAITNGWTNGTTPATNAIRYVGWAGVTGGTMPRMVDNTWLDEIRRLPDGSPGIIVEGRNGGSTDWNSSDIFNQLGFATGTFIPAAGGAWQINTPIQFGINDTTTHGFTDTNAQWLWANAEFLPDDVYSISALGNAGGTTNVTFGIKTGTGNDATGAQGLVVSSASDGPRWSIDVDDPNLDSIGFYGCLFNHGNDFQVDDAAVELIGTTLLDVSTMTLGGGLLQRSTVVNANTADGVPFITSNDPTRIKFTSFEFSDGHAIEITSAVGEPFTFQGNTFAGYGADGTTDAAILADNLTFTLSVANGGDTPTVREINGADVTVENNVSVTVAGLQDDTEAAAYVTSTGALIAEAEPATDGSPGNRSFTFSAGAGVDVYITLFNLEWNVPPNNRIDLTVPNNDTTIPVTQVTDRVYDNP